jgi:predicted kinase
MLLIFGGLLATGKTTLALALAKHFSATYIRIDTIEQAIKDSLNISDIEAAGYNVGYKLAQDNLLINNIIVADSVNSLEVTRQTWRECATEINKPFIEIEIVCSNKHDHKTRAETRLRTIKNHKLPTWDDVITRKFEPWLCSHIVIDTANKTVEESINDLLLQIEEFKRNNLIDII